MNLPFLRTLRTPSLHEILLAPEPLGAAALRLRIRDRKLRLCVEIRFQALATQNGFKRFCEVAVSVLNLGTEPESEAALSQRVEFAHARGGQHGEVSMADCEVTRTGSKGRIQSRGEAFAWELQASFALSSDEGSLLPGPRNSLALSAVPVTGWIDLNGERIALNDATAWVGNAFGMERMLHWDWVFGEVPSVSPPNQPTLLLEGRSESLTLPIFGNALRVLPPVHVFRITYRGEPYVFNSLRSPLSIKVALTGESVNFVLEKKALRFEGWVKSTRKGGARFTCEDPHERILQVFRRENAQAEVHAYREGKLESSFVATGGMVFEQARRT